MLNVALRTLSRPLSTHNLRCQQVLPKRLTHNLARIVGESKFLPKGSYEFLEENANFETSTSEWEFVEKLIPLKYIPEPGYPPGTVTPSGWVAPSAKPGQYPYYIIRNVNHLLKIYRDISPIYYTVTTRLKGIEGDVFALRAELQAHLKKLTGRPHVSVRAHEPHGVLIIKGDYTQPIREFLVAKGF